MKKLPLLMMLLSLVLTQACRGPEGLPGPEGPPGPAGGLEYGTVFDITGSFTAANQYSLAFTFPTNEVEVFESDIVLAYIEWETSEGSSVWRLLPQLVFAPQGTMQYNFDYTPADVSIFLDGPAGFNFGSLEPSYTQNQLFRVVIVPSVFGGGKLPQETDFSNYEEVIKKFNLSDKKVKTYQSRK